MSASLIINAVPLGALIRYTDGTQKPPENGNAKVDQGSGVIISLRAM